MKKGVRKTGLLLLSLSLLLVAALTGCTGGVDGLTPEELVQNVVEASEGIETVQYEMSMTMDTTGNAAGEQIDMSITSSGGGVIDILNEKMQMTMTSRFPEGEGMPSGDMEVQMYFIDGMLYIKNSMEGVPDCWTKGEMPWGFQPVPTEQLVQLLKASEVEIVGKEEVKGIDCFIVAVVPDVNKLMEIMAQQGGLPPEMMEAMTGMEDMFRDVTITQWIARDTFLPVKEHTQMTMVMTSENTTTPVPEGGEFEMSMTMDMTAYYSNYNEVVSIVLPDGAAEAVEAP